MSPRQTVVPAWQRVLEAHATWQHWTAALRVYWLPDGVIVRDIPPDQWGPEVTSFEFPVEGYTMPPPRIRLWRLCAYALPRYRVSIVPQDDSTVLELRIREK